MYGFLLFFIVIILLCIALILLFSDQFSSFFSERNKEKVSYTFSIVTYRDLYSKYVSIQPYFNCNKIVFKDIDDPNYSEFGFKYDIVRVLKSFIPSSADINTVTNSQLNTILSDLKAVGPSFKAFSSKKDSMSLIKVLINNRVI